MQVHYTHTLYVHQYHTTRLLRVKTNVVVSRRVASCRHDRKKDIVFTLVQHKRSKTRERRDGTKKNVQKQKYKRQGIRLLKMVIKSCNLGTMIQRRVARSVFAYRKAHTAKEERKKKKKKRYRKRLSFAHCALSFHKTNCSATFNHFQIGAYEYARMYDASGAENAFCLFEIPRSGGSQFVENSRHNSIIFKVLTQTSSLLKFIKQNRLDYCTFDAPQSRFQFKRRCNLFLPSPRILPFITARKLDLSCQTQPKYWQLFFFFSSSKFENLF